ncbi:complement C1r subcomponent-like [Perca fluviatilis]|uniref:complement C1r subcomponent-like n=1 Tax=Perca fluviatilis TaxID=8168 RepID=UPI001962FA7B|nr:complement C1r subcomponent-like [Perca fluviatilis]
MGRTYCFLWFLCLSASFCWQLPSSGSAIHGQVQSPLFPRPYLPNLLRQWDVWVPEGYVIQLSLTHLDIKASSGCHQDSLMVLYDQNVLGKFCGQENSTDHPGKEPILSQGNKLTLIFQTSDFNTKLQQHIGFSATYKAIDFDECSQPDPGDGSGPLCSHICVNTPGSYRCSCHHGYKLHLDQHTCLMSCGGCIFDKNKGHLASPRYPHPSPPLLSCLYIITVEPSLTVTLNFTNNFHIDSMDTEQGPSCVRHWLQVTIPDREPIKLCGGNSPGLIATNSNTVRLDYHTDVEGLSRGWSLDYSTNKIDCGEPEPLLNGGVIFLSGFQNQYRSVIQYHCNAPFYSLPGGNNVTFTCEADRKWRSNHNDVTPTCIPVCGKHTKLISAYQRIIGGSDAPDDTIPWQVLLNIDGGRGGGMVIGDRWVMTVAHNVMKGGNQVSKETVQMYMGITDVKTQLVSPVYAASIHIHPEYNNPNYVDYNHDIALIKLQDPITFNSSIMPICLPAEGATYVTGVMGLVSGFGIAEGDGRLILKSKINYVQLPVVEQETCSKSITSLKKTRDNVPSLSNNMFCAGVPEGGLDSCQGDTGGPYALRDDGRFWAAGIVSWGVDCGKQGTYGVYTRVTNYMDWINKTMQEN